jgi:hypothetical protein
MSWHESDAGSPRQGLAYSVARGGSENLNFPTFFFLKSYFILQSVVIHLAECYGERVLQCLGERPSVGPLRR